MIFHLSIAAHDPERAAKAIADLWSGQAFPFPHVGHGSWLAIADDGEGTTMEVYPLGSELVAVEGDADAVAATSPNPRLRTATHAAIATNLTQDAVFAIAGREGWLAKYRKRGGIFGVIEFWVENSVLLEVLTPAMQAEYLGFMSPQNWREMLAKGPPVAA